MAKKLDSKNHRTITLPPVISEIPVYIQRNIGHVDVKFKGAGLVRWRQLFADLVAGARFKDGRPVQSSADCFHWLVEQASEANFRGPESPESPKESPKEIPKEIPIES
jgi:hypothetical protein